jgi:NAD(P)-dependent dehydrogenase (short-subunit alcohol dehydrogenase family)
MTPQVSRVAVVTGAGSGIGAAVARAMAAEGYAVALAGRRAQALAEVADAIARDGGTALAVPTDVADPTSVGTLFSTVATTWGRVDVLFNNAGRRVPSTPVDEIRLEDWLGSIATNLTGAFLCTQEAVRLMKRQSPSGGRIINNGSLSAHVPRLHSAAYTATKHAITGLTKATALDGRAHGIACGQIDIGNAATDMTERMTVGALQADGTMRPEPRMDVAEVARAVLLMAGMPLSANVQNMTVMATTMPYLGRG